MPDDIEDFGASTATDTKIIDAVEAPTPDAKDPAAQSSSAADEPKSTASIVRDVVAKAADKGKSDSSPEGEKKVEEQAASEKDRDPDDYSDVPFNKHPRFQEITRKLRESRKQVETYKVDAERYNNVQTFLDNHGLSAEEAANGLMTFALAKTNPAEAWKRIRPWVQKLVEAAGEVLPQDLAGRVEAGELTRDAALEVSRSRATVKSLETHSQFERDRQVRQSAEAQQAAVMRVASEWEADRQLKDPNFAAKVPILQAKLAEIHRRDGVAKDPDTAKKQLQDAYKFANEYHRPAAPAVTTKPAITPIKGGTVAANAAAGDAPKSTLDIVRAKMREHAAAG